MTRHTPPRPSDEATGRSTLPRCQDTGGDSPAVCEAPSPASVRPATVADNPRLRANRFPWNAPSSTARKTLETFLDVAQRRIDARPDTLPFPAGVGQLVLAWLRARLDTPPRA